MSHNPQEPVRKFEYDRVPSTNDPRSDPFHLTPSPSPEPPSLSYHTPQLSTRDLPPVPSGSGQHLSVDAQYDSPNTSRSSHLVPSISIPPSYHTYASNSDSPLLGREESPSLNAAALPQPRFLGAALYDENGPQQSRYSLVSNHTAAPSIGGHSDFNSSVYALNDAQGSTYFDDRSSYRDDPAEGSYSPHRTNRPPLDRSRYLDEKRLAYTSPRKVSKRKLLLWSILGGTIIIIAAVVIPLYFAVIKPKNNSTGQSQHTSAAQPSGTSRPGQHTAQITGGDGSTVTLEDGTTFVYHNSFGGYWYYDENDPFNTGARAQSWTPALNETFQYGIDRIRGVNLGGWLVTEPFMQSISSVPALFEAYPGSVDEWTLSQKMAADTANGGLSQLENHYKTFITEQDFAQIAGAGLNFVRIPLAYWAIEVRDGEPFLAKTSWTYFLKAIKWARKYGIRINLDLHALPGSQNGWNHSGRLGTVNVLNGPMGLANAQRALDYIRILAEFISQPQYSNVVTIFGITNEPQGSVIGLDNLSRYYLQAYNVVREASGVGEGKGPYVSVHDAFYNRNQWAGFLTGADRISLDSHPYLCFQGQSNAPISSYATTPCQTWGGAVNASMAAFGLSTAGEFSNAVTDCGLWVNGVDLGSRYDGTYTLESSTRVGSCDVWTEWQNYDQSTKDAIKQFAMASMDALQNWFFWTWKIGNSSITGKVEAPAWSYQLGLEHGWMPQDVRQAVGACNNVSPWSPPLSAWQTGGAGADQIAATVSAALAWPPATISGGGAASLLPTYTPTGPVPTLPEPSISPSPTGHAFSSGSGWNNAADTAGLMVPVPSCSYLDPWIGAAPPPSPLCGGGTRRRNEDDDGYAATTPLITPAPV